MEDEKKKQIDVGEIFRRINEHKKKFSIVILSVAVVSSLLIIQVPRTYKCDVSLAPESDDLASGGSLSSLASSFGFDLGNAMPSADAIYPLLYPDLFKSNDFIVSLFDIEVTKIDGSLSTSYYDYLLNHQDYPFWAPAINWIKRQIAPAPKYSAGSGGTSSDNINPFQLTVRQDALVKSVKNSIKCDVDKKTNVISITVTDQDPLICATLADSVRQRLQNFITAYRTSKARADYKYYKDLTDNAKSEYDDAMQAYSAFCDTHKNVILQAYISQRDDLENDMQTKFSSYSALNTQLQAVKARIQEKTPAFTLLQSATVPVKPDGPKRMIFVLAMVSLTFIIMTGYYSRDMLFK